MTVNEFNEEVTTRLLAWRTAEGVWRGELSSSALATAVAAFALELAAEPGDAQRVRSGLEWLEAHGNGDGGWGDTTRSASNVSTTLLVWSALARTTGAISTGEASAEGWLSSRIGALDGDAIVGSVLEHYGSDRTFSVPILTMCALAECLGPGSAWRRIPQLPYELSVLPRGLFRFAGFPVVSYALPALIAMGVVRHRRAGRWWESAGLGALRSGITPRVLSLLESIQPVNGGFLEAVPLTGFVAMSLIGAGLGAHPVVRRALTFLRTGQRSDGSWPIDTDLSVWLTTMASRALADVLPHEDRMCAVNWLLRQQFRSTHPFTGAAPGGWGWTDCPGSVPDADDTSGVLGALHVLLGEQAGRAVPAARRGLEWLMGLQNRDGGMPTFCRGWGALPFDRSCPDITAHALEAVTLWQPLLGRRLGRRLSRRRSRLIRFLLQSQSETGSWVPLWFGNEHAPDGANPVYGTARVLVGLLGTSGATDSKMAAAIQRAVDYLTGAQNPDGGWGGDAGIESTVEETALAVRALASVQAARTSASRGLRWLTDHVDCLDKPAPIGLYFASLWYFEKLYPLVFASDAVRACLRCGVTL